MDQSRHLVPSLRQIFCAALRVYQGFSSLGLPRCRFYPSCSEYMRQSIEQVGVRRGFVRGLRRLLRCHPWHPGGYDPVHTPHEENLWKTRISS